MFEHIPLELRLLNQWCIYRLEQGEGDKKPTKVPYNPHTMRLAASTRPVEWSSYQHALEAYNAGKATGLGFFFSSHDPYFGIDLDDPYAVDPDTGAFVHENPDAIAARHAKVMAEFDTYAEVSPSGKGVHIIGIGDVPHGRRRDGVEVYSVARFFTMTGNVVKNRPLADHREKVRLLWDQMSVPEKPLHFFGSIEQQFEDIEIFQKAEKAANGDKFLALYNGDWQNYYSSQSEADFALIDIIAYYSDSQFQIARMFRDSALGKRDKANRDNYILPMIRRAFDNRLPDVDFSGYLEELAKAEAEKARGPSPTAAAEFSSVVAPVTPSSGQQSAGAGLTGLASATSHDTTYYLKHQPPGVLNMLVDYVMRSSPRPTYEIALVSAIGLLAGIVGRQYNVSNTGLNLYLMLIASTGTGKEAISSSISRMLSKVARTNGIEQHEAAMFVRGPSEIASGQALLKHMAVAPRKSFVSVVGEFGLKLQQITSTNANTSDIALRRAMLDLYGKSGAGDVLPASIYADKDKNTEIIMSPAFTMIGESTGETFYAALDLNSVAQGLLPRFLTVEYTGNRPKLNPNHADAIFPEQLRLALSNLIAKCDEMARTDKVIGVKETPDAEAYLLRINDECDALMDMNDKEAVKQLWNRVHVKTLRVAALLAVAHNFEEPEINTDMVHWAYSLVARDTLNIIGRFERGEMGVQDDADDTAKFDYMIRLIKTYMERPFTQLPKYGANPDLHKKSVINLAYMSKATASAAPFRKDRRGANMALSIILKAMCDHGDLRELPFNQLEKEFKFAGKAYTIINPKKFLSFEN